MSQPLEAVVLAVVLAALAAFLLACVRAVRKSRRLQRHYRQASPAERAALDARARTEPELAHYMLPMPIAQGIIGLAAVALLVWAKFSGYL